MSNSPTLYRFSHEAMATRFEIIIADCDPDYAGQASDAAFKDIDELEAVLSRYRPDSDLARIAALRPGHQLGISLATFDCLSLAKDVAAETGGAFDVTIGPIYRLWRTKDGSMRAPSEEAQAEARSRTGIHLFDLVPDGLRLETHTAGLELDLGGIGKGYALDQAADVLRQWDIDTALLNAGDSTVLAMDPPEDSEAWLVGAGGEGAPPVHLKNRALSGSGFAVKGSHIINPRTGLPAPIARGKERTWAAAPTATLADALSTAFIVMERDEIDSLCTRHQEVEAILLDPELAADS
ncbi:FAD:protein FMN transferase [soil metagenome]